MSLFAADREPGLLREVRWEARVRGAVLLTDLCPLEADPAQARCDFTLTVPAFVASAARSCERADHSSCSARPMPSFAFTLSEPSPMCT